MFGELWFFQLSKSIPPPPTNKCSLCLAGQGMPWFIREREREREKEGRGLGFFEDIVSALLQGSSLCVPSYQREIGLHRWRAQMLWHHRPTRGTMYIQYSWIAILLNYLIYWSQARHALCHVGRQYCIKNCYSALQNSCPLERVNRQWLSSA